MVEERKDRRQEKKKLRRRVVAVHRRKDKLRSEMEWMLKNPWMGDRDRMRDLYDRFIALDRCVRRMTFRLRWNELRKGAYSNKTTLEVHLRHYLNKSASGFLAALVRMPWRKCSGREGY